MTERFLLSSDAEKLKAVEPSQAAAIKSYEALLVKSAEGREVISLAEAQNIEPTSHLPKSKPEQPKLKHHPPPKPPLAVRIASKSAVKHSI